MAPSTSALIRPFSNSSHRARNRTILALVCILSVLGATIAHAFLSVNSSNIAFSKNSNRSQSQTLGLKTVSGNIFVFVSLKDPNIRDVKYHIDPSGSLDSRTLFATRAVAPYDLGGTHFDGSAIAFDTKRLTNGSHLIATQITLRNGYVHHDFTWFNVNNSTPPPTTPATTSTTRPAPTTAPPSVAPTTRPVTTNPPVASGSGRVVVYYGYWSYWSGLTPSQIPASKVTDINYSFANVVNGRCVSEDASHDSRVASELVALRNRNPHLRLTLAVGGASWSSGFTQASSPQNRSAFVQSCLNLATNLGFDGIDVDWEYPSAGERTTWAELLSTFRTQMNSRTSPSGKPWQLTSAIPVGWYLQNDSRFDVARAHTSVDFLNLMAYDMRGSWSGTTGHHAALRPAAGDPEALGSVESLNYLERQGVPRSKMVLGVPFYGYRFTGVSPTNNGLFQSKSGAVQVPYKDLLASDLGSAQKFRDANAVAPYAYNASQRTFITYDDPAAIREKANFSANNRYGGVMAWELSQDASGWPLLSAMAAPFGR